MYPDLWRLAIHRGHALLPSVQHVEIEDFAADVLLAFYRNWPKLAPQGDVAQQKWVMTAMRNRIADWMRLRAVRPHPGALDFDVAEPEYDGQDLQRDRVLKSLPHLVPGQRRLIEDILLNGKDDPMSVGDRQMRLRALRQLRHMHQVQ